MRSNAPALLPIFRSTHQAELLALLLLHPEKEYTATEIAERFKVPTSTLHPEVRRLVQVGLIRSRRIGRTQLLSAEPANRLTKPMTELLNLTYGPQYAAGQAFATVPGAEAVLIFGSWASRYHGTPGPPPRDLDLLVLGNPDRADVYDAADEVQRRVDIEVNPVIRGLENWRAADDPLIRQIKTDPVLWVKPISKDQGEDADETMAQG